MLKGLVNTTDAQVEKMNKYILLTIPEKEINKE